MYAIVPLNIKYFIVSLWVIKSAQKQNGLNLRTSELSWLSINLTGKPLEGLLYTQLSILN